MKERLLWADSLKGWLMFLVVFGHSIQQILLEDCTSDHLWNYIYTFHMPGFMAVSGYLLYRKESRNSWKIGRRFHQLMLPYCLWSIISFILSGDYSVSHLSEIILNPDSYFWFLWVLFWIYVLFAFSQRIAVSLHVDELYSICIMCALLMGIMVVFDFRLFGFQFVAYYFLFYTFGYLIHCFPKTKVHNNTFLCVLIFCWCIMGYYWDMHELPTWMPSFSFIPNTVLQYIYRGTTALIALYILFCLSPKVLNSTSSKINQHFAATGKESLGLYVFHILLLGIISPFFRTYIGSIPTFLIIVVLFVVAYMVSTFIVHFLYRNRVTARYLFGLK